MKPGYYTDGQHLCIVYPNGSFEWFNGITLEWTLELDERLMTWLDFEFLGEL